MLLRMQFLNMYLPTMEYKYNLIYCFKLIVACSVILILTLSDVCAFNGVYE